MPTHYKGTSREKNALNAYIKLMRATSAIDSVMRKSLAERGLTTSQLGILEAIYHLGPLKQKDLADKMLMSGGNITTVIDNLEKNEMVSRMTCPDRRAYEITLTPKGKKYISGILPEHVREITRIMSRLNAEELKTLAELTGKLGLGIE